MMYNYADETKCSPTPTNCVEHEAPLSALMTEAISKSNDTLMMVKKINRHLFGKPEDATGGEKEPLCFMEFVKLHNKHLGELYEELIFMMDRLGV